MQFLVQDVDKEFWYSGKIDGCFSCSGIRETSGTVDPFNISNIDNTGKFAVMFAHPFHLILEFFDLLDFVDTDFYKRIS
jgi:hypothetical protein